MKAKALNGSAISTTNNESDTPTHERAREKSLGSKQHQQQLWWLKLGKNKSKIAGRISGGAFSSLS